MYSLRLITYYLNRIRYGGTTLVGSGGARLSGPKNMDFYQRSQKYFRKTSYTIGINRMFPNKAKCSGALLLKNCEIIGKKFMPIATDRIDMQGFPNKYNQNS